MPADPDMDDGSKPTGGDSGTGAKLTERDRLLDRGRSPSREGTSSSAPNGDEGAAEDSTLLISKNGASAEPKTKKLGGKAGAKGTSGAKKSATAGAKADAGAKPTKGKAKGKSPIRKDNGAKGAPKGKTGRDATGDNGGGTAEPKDGEKRIAGGRGRGTNKEDKKSKSSAGQQQQSQQSLQALEEASKGGADLGYLNYVLDVLPFVKTNMPLGFGYYMSMKPSATAEPALFDSSAATNHGLRIRVRQLTGMGTELHLVRPYVVVHVLNRYTGRYIRPDGMQAVVAPVRTLECSMREGSPVPIWNKELTPNGPLNDLVNPHTIIMYELLDSRVPIKSKRIGLAGRTIKRVAWAFQVPCGADNRRLTVGVPDEWRATSTAHKAPVEDEDEEAVLAAREAAKAPRDMAVPLQLYAYQKGDLLGLDALQRKYMGWHSYGGSSFFESVKSSASANPLSLVSDDSSYPDGVPEVYVQWRKQSVESIKGTLMVAAGAVERVPENFRESAAMAAKLDESVIEDNQDGAVLGGAESAHSDVGLKYKLAAAARTRSNPREPCTIPTRLLHRLDVGPDGASAVAFSNSGAWLAVGAVVSGASTGLSAPYPGSVYALKIYDPDTGFERWFNDAAHHGPIYSIQWSKDDQYILTTSGDSTVRVWRLALTRVPITGPESAQKRKSTHRRSSGKGDGADSAAMVPTTEALSVTPVANMRHMPLVHVYCAVFQETTLPTAAPTSMSSDGSPSQDKDGASAKSEKHFIPTVVTGASDGHLRVWSGSAYQGSLLIRGGGQSKSLEDSICEEAPHFFAVQDVTIDTRTRYLLSGDAGGNIMLWRLDAHGWYNLLRKFKKDDLPGTCITTMCMHPEKTKGQLLVMAKPATLRVYSLSTYRMVNSYPGAVNELPGLTRACFSADGAFVAAGSELPSQGGGGGSSGGSGGSPGGYRLRLWNTQGGGQESSDLTEMTMPFPIRAVAWHPTQHMVVVGMQGAGASVAILVAKKESAAIQARKRNSLALKSLFNAADDDGDGTDASAMGGPTGATSTTPFGDTFGSATSSNSPASERAAKARSMIEKIRATRAKARQEGQLRRAAERDETSEDGKTAEASGVAGDRLVSNSLTALPSSRGMSATMATPGRLSDNLSRAPATPASATMR